MTVEERSRRELQEALVDTIGPEPTDTLLSYLPPTGWADVATTRDLQAMRAELRGEISELRAEVHIFATDLRSEMNTLSAELRSEMNTLSTELRGEMAHFAGDLRGEMAHLRADLHRELRVQFYSLAGLMIGILALVLAASANGLLE